MFNQAKRKVVVVVPHPRLDENFTRLKGPVSILIPQSINPFTVRDEEFTVHDHDAARIVKAIRHLGDRHIGP